MSRIQTHCLALIEKQYTKEIKTNEYRIEEMLKLFSINPICIKYSVLCIKLMICVPHYCNRRRETGIVFTIPGWLRMKMYIHSVAACRNVMLLVWQWRLVEMLWCWSEWFFFLDGLNSIRVRSFLSSPPPSPTPFPVSYFYLCRVGLKTRASKYRQGFLSCEIVWVVVL